jgi:homoserine kinase
MSFTPLKVSVPATTANLGAGFDCLGLALALRNEIDVRPSDTPRIRVEGEGKEALPASLDNLVWRTFCKGFQQMDREPPAVEILCGNRIPLARGLGSSAAVRIAALMAANEIAGQPFDNDRILQIAAAEEGHPDNVAPALFGGMVVCGRDGDRTVTRRFEPASGIRVVLLIPEMTLETEEARRILPDTCSMADSVSNLQNTALTTFAFLTGDYGVLSTSLHDRLHQPYRKALIPGFDRTLEAAREAGAHGAALSGAGPTMAAFTDRNEEAVAEAMQAAFAESGGGGSRTAVVEVDLLGAFVSALPE